MNKFIGIVCLIGILFLTFVGYSHVVYMQRATLEFHTVHLGFAVDNATDAATEALLESSELGLDYTNPEEFNIDPQNAMDVFIETLLLNYNMPVTEKNIQMVKLEFIPVFMVASSDGYYMATPMNIKSDTDYPESAPSDVDVQLQFKPKMPYKYTYGGETYGLNFGAQNYIKITTANEVIKKEGLPPGLTSKEAVVAEINKIVSTEIAYTIETLNSSNPYYNGAFFIPSGVTTVRGSQNMAGPSVIAIVQNVQLDTPRPINAFSIGGGKISLVRYLVGYTVGGTKYYCYADQLESSVTPDNLFINMREAANAGYFPDIRRLSK